MKQKILKKNIKEKKNNKTLQVIIGIFVGIIGCLGYLMMICVTDPMSDYSKYIEEYHIGYLELSDGYWISQEHYEDILTEKMVYLKREDINK